MFTTDITKIQQFETFSTVGLGLGSIETIELLPSLESHYDNIVVTVIPEPSSVVLTLFVAALVIVRNRVWRHT